MLDQSPRAYKSDHRIKWATDNFKVCLKRNGPRCTHSGAANANVGFYFAAEGAANPDEPFGGLDRLI